MAPIDGLGLQAGDTQLRGRRTFAFIRGATRISGDLDAELFRGILVIILFTTYYLNDLLKISFNV
jgi:hypothetical protein